jgi:hypothetical protein
VCRSHCGLAIYIKNYLKAKEENYENLNISPCRNIIFKKVFSSLLESGNFGPHSKKVGPLGVLEGFWQSFLNKECVGHTVASPFTLKTILRRGTL